jgi:hypothetical protein
VPSVNELKEAPVDTLMTSVEVTVVPSSERAELHPVVALQAFSILLVVKPLKPPVLSAAHELAMQPNIWPLLSMTI